MEVPNNSRPPVNSDQSASIAKKSILGSVFILLAIIVVLVSVRLFFIWYFRRQYLRSRERALQRMYEQRVLYFSRQGSFPDDPNAPNFGLHPTVLSFLPIFVYTEETTSAMECSICLSEFKAKEKGRVLPGCKHAFHVDCIDMWFHSHSTCPVCRSVVEVATTSSSAPAPEEDTKSSVGAITSLRNMLGRDRRSRSVGGAGIGEGERRSPAVDVDLERGGAVDDRNISHSQQQ